MAMNHVDTTCHFHGDFRISRFVARTVGTVVDPLTTAGRSPIKEVESPRAAWLSVIETHRGDQNTFRRGIASYLPVICNNNLGKSIFARFIMCCI